MTDATSPTIVDAQPVSFDGRLSESLRIAALNTLLQVATLGVYRFWARSRYRRFLWRETRFFGEPFEYTGRGIHLFVGFLIALLILVPVLGVVDLLATASGDWAPVISIANLIVLFLLLEYGLYRARGYRLGHTLWRGIRFGQTGSEFRYARVAFESMLAVALTGGIAKPWMDARQFAFRWGHTWFGDRRFEVEATTVGLWRYWLGMYVAMALVIAVSSGFQEGETIPTWRYVFVLAMYLLAALAYGLYRIAQFKMFTASMRFSGAWFSSGLRGRDLLGPAIVYGLALVLIGFLVIGRHRRRLVLPLPSDRHRPARHS
ncbi:MAG: DUF898 family protein [Alphaproteobacteria bacterium]|nr:DUF898 family protein [Alphaproteobacteria bacterium]